uniref:Nonstructural polyprotein n=1 Tax=Hypsignathus monstrosus dicistrovirus TaxID=2499245 RepID=A0A3Q9HII5_9VIRU|nr:nonstructural polyprotein [Hypsignathus monstrosus dicistrovirus]
MSTYKNNAQMIQTCVGAFYFGEEIVDFLEIVHDIKSWDFNGGMFYDLESLVFGATDSRLFKVLSEIVWDEMNDFAMFHLPYRFRHMFDELNITSEWDIIQRLLMLAGDVERNPGPVQSRPSLIRNNDPRTVKLEKALERKDQKIKKLIKDLRIAIKRNKIHAQGMFDSINGIQGTAGELNGNLNRICNFLENSLPTLQANIQATVLNTTDKYVQVKDDLMKLTLICLLIRLLMVWGKYKTAIAIILLFVLKYYNFDDKIIELVNELRSKFVCTQGIDMEEIVYHPYYQTCGKIIFAVIAFICIRKIPGKQDWDSYITRLDRIPKAIDGSRKIVDYCSEYFNLANDQVKEMILEKQGFDILQPGKNKDIKLWAQEVRKYMDLAERSKIDTNIDVANIVEDLYKKGLAFQADTLLSREMSRLVSTTLLPARELYQYVSCSPVKGGGPRMRPICLWLIGESGVGKTEMVYPLCIDVLREMGLMGRQDFHHQVYGRQVETEFWDGYKGQKIVIYDDAFQMKDDKTSPNPEIFEVIRSCNTFPQHLHMAALHDKNTFSAAELLLYTTNNANVQLESITFPEAFFNRVGEHAYRVQPKLEFSKVVPRGESGTTYRKLDKSKLSKELAIDLSIYEFQKIIKSNSLDAPWEDCGDPLSYTQFANIICTEWRKKKTESLNKLKFLENYAIRAQVGDEFLDCEYDDAWFRHDLKMKEGMSKEEIWYEYSADQALFDAYKKFLENQYVETKWDKFRKRIDTCLTSVEEWIQSVSKKSLEFVQSHPILTALGFVGMALSMFSLYKWFEQSISAEAEVGVSGDVKTIKQQQRFVEVGVSGDAKTSKQQRKNVEVGVSGDVKTLKQVVKKVEVLDKELEEHIETQGCSDLVAHNLVTDILQKNTYRLSYFRGEKRVPFGNCTFVRGWMFLIPYHFLQALYARRLAPETIICFSQSKFSDIIQIPLSHIIEGTIEGFNLTNNCVQLKHKNGDLRDCVAINLHRRMCHPHRDLVKHFVKVEDQGKLSGKFCGTLATYHENNGEIYRTYQWLQQIRALDKPITIYLPENDGFSYKESSYVQRDCYEYNAPTQVGDCGSIVGIYNHRIERKLIGIHIAGTNEQFGYACPLTQEAIDCACDELVVKDITNISAQFYYELPKGVDGTKEPNLPEGLFCPLGKSDLQVGQPTKTSLVKSCIYGKLSTPFMAPALLKPKMINGELVDPLMKGLKKCGVDTAVLSDEEVKNATRDVCQTVLTQYNSQLDRAKYQRILTYEEAIMGTGDDCFMKAINRTTSPGFPYSLDTKGHPGKTKWMGKAEKFDFESFAAKQLRADVEELIEDCCNGKISNVLFVDTLKDERRTFEKVNVGKTRVFSAGPQHFVVAFRKYFLPFSAWLMHNRIDNEVAVGTNPYSLDWEKLAKKMKSKGMNVIAGDFGNFDGSLVAQILWAIFWEIFVPWLEQFNDFTTSEGMDTLKICLGLWSHLVHSVHIFKNNVYMWTHSQPSGNPFTVIINCLYNSSIMRVAWQRIMMQKNPKLVSMKYFRKYVSIVTYGDDNELNIADEVIDFFNQETISEVMAEMKHEYTDEGKTGQLVKARKLEDTFFLKRGFRWSRELQRTVAPLKLEVIYEMLNWTRNTIDPNEILMSNIDTAFREVVFHGREEYEKLRNGIKGIVKDLPSVPQILTYEQYLHDIKYLADEVYEF